MALGVLNNSLTVVKHAQVFDLEVQDLDLVFELSIFDLLVRELVVDLFELKAETLVEISLGLFETDVFDGCESPALL